MLTIGGEEVMIRAGHCGAIGLPPQTWIDWRYRPEDDLPGRFVDQVHGVGGLAIANHPHASCKACNWGFGYGPMDAIEVWNGTWDNEDEASLADWDAELRAGDRKVAVSGSDAHRAPDLIGRPQTVVRAAGLDRRDVLAGIRAGRVYIAEAEQDRLAFTASSGANVAQIGDTLPGRTAKLRLRVQGAGGAAVTFHTDHGPAGTQPVAGDDDTVTGQAANARWVCAEVRRSDGSMIALTDPIWLGR